MCRQKASPVIIRAQHAKKYFAHVTVDSLIAAMQSSKDDLTAFFDTNNEEGVQMPAGQVVERWISNKRVYM